MRGASGPIRTLALEHLIEYVNHADSMMTLMTKIFKVYARTKTCFLISMAER